MVEEAPNVIAKRIFDRHKKNIIGIDPYTEGDSFYQAVQTELSSLAKSHRSQVEAAILKLAETERDAETSMDRKTAYRKVSTLIKTRVDFGN